LTVIALFTITIRNITFTINGIPMSEMHGLSIAHFVLGTRTTDVAITVTTASR